MFTIQISDQMVKNCLHVATASRWNNGVIDDSFAEDSSVVIRKDARGITATGEIYGKHYAFYEQDVVDAIAVYWQVYHSVPADCVRIELTYDATSGEFGAEIVWVG